MRTLRSFYETRLFHLDNSLVQCLLSAFRWLYRTQAVQSVVYRRWMNDRDYIRKLYRERFGKFPDLDNPRSFNEKNNWRKLNDRKEIYTQMVDKFGIKSLIKDRAGEEYAFKLLGHWDNPEDIDFDSLPDKFVLKPNHSGGVVICRDKAKFDRRAAIKRLKKALKANYFMRSREWPYKNVKRCVMAEEYMGENLCDYKNYVFNGKLMYTLVWKNVPNGDSKPTAYFCGMYDREWKKTDMELKYPSLPNQVIEKPACYDEMVAVAEKMARDTIFVRCDFYIIDNHPYVGEMTFFPWGGFQKFKDEKWNDYLGSLERLPCRC